MQLMLTLLNVIFSLGLTGLGIIPYIYNDAHTTKPNIGFAIVSPLFPPPTPTPTPLPTPIPSPTPTPTPRPLTFTEMNMLYGPCAYVPTLFWHHVQNTQKAKELGHAQLTVDTAEFRSQMQYIQGHGYTSVRPEQLIAFFDSGVPLPPKPILLTFDDGYDDFASDAAPIIREFGFQATIFIPTGLMNNTGFMTWDTIAGLGGSNFYFGNHTWSHKNMDAGRDIDEKEITTADGQLSNHGVNNAKVFAYPYGSPNSYAMEILQKLEYKLAFTTYGGSIQCKQQRLALPRTRIGNGSLSNYGL